MKNEQSKKPFERFTGFMERVNHVAGIAFIGAGVILESVPMAAIGALQFVEAAVWKRLGNRDAKKARTALTL